MVLGVSAQNLHTQANAASIDNEANSVTGWTTNSRAIATSSAVNTFAGSFSISVALNGSTGGYAGYTFTAVVGEVYDISIWAREGNLSFQPAFANWSGLANFSTTAITGSNWTQYTWSLTATSTSPEIRVYAAPWSGGQAGTEVLIDNVSITLQGSGADTQPPSAPANLTANGTTTTTTNLSWNASTDNVGVTGYTILQDGASIGTTNGATTFNVTGLTQNTSYAFTVTANDAAGNVSGSSNTANVTTLTAADNQPPSAPSNLTANGTTTTTTNLTWNASTDNVGVTGYTVLQDGVSIGTTNGATTFNVTGLAQNTSYAFTVTARDAAGNISAPSNTANVTTTGTGVVDYTSENANLATVDWTARDLFANRNVGIGTTNTQGYQLAVAGSVVAEEVNVKLQVNWPDYVFENSYNLPSLEEVEAHIQAKGYLLDMPSAAQVEQSGIDIGKMNAKLLRKIEELTLYTLAQEKKIKALEEQNKKLESLSQKLAELEKVMEEKR